MAVAAAVIVEAVHPAHAATVPLRQLLGIHRVLDVPDDDALLERVAPLGAVQEGQRAAQGRDHEAAGHLDLGRALALERRPVDELDVVGLGRVGHVEDVPAGMRERGAVEVVAAVHLLHGHLETGLAVQIVVADLLDILGQRRGARYEFLAVAHVRSSRLLDGPVAAIGTMVDHITTLVSRAADGTTFGRAGSSYDARMECGRLHGQGRVRHRRRLRDQAGRSPAASPKRAPRSAWPAATCENLDSAVLELERPRRPRPGRRDGHQRRAGTWSPPSRSASPNSAAWTSSSTTPASAGRPSTCGTSLSTSGTRCSPSISPEACSPPGRCSGTWCRPGAGGSIIMIGSEGGRSGDGRSGYPMRAPYCSRQDGPHRPHGDAGPGVRPARHPRELHHAGRGARRAVRGHDRPARRGGRHHLRRGPGRRDEDVLAPPPRRGVGDRAGVRVPGVRTRQRPSPGRRSRSTAA